MENRNERHLGNKFRVRPERDSGAALSPARDIENFLIDA